MAIPASQIVQVLPRVLTGTGADLAFNGLFLDNSGLLQANTPTAFATADEVADAFGATSKEYEAAAIYFGGYNGSQIKPGQLYFYRLTPTAAAPWVRGRELDPAAALTAIKAITAGDFQVILNGSAVSVTALDMSAAASLSDAAALLQNAIRATSTDPDAPTPAAGVTVTFSSLFNAFIITGGETGVEASITGIGGTLASAFGLDSGTTVSAGADAASVTETLNSLTGQFQNFVSFAFIDEPDDDTALEAARWASQQSNAGTMYLFVLQDSDSGNNVGSNTEVIAEVLKANEIGATCVCYPDTNMAAFIMGVAASINWDARQGALTFAFKRQSGLGASVTKASAALAMQAHSVNYIGNYATRNDNFVWLYNGCMLGDWGWIDAYLNAVWLSNACQVQLMAMFEANRRIPYTEAGYSIVRANIRDVINRGLFNGVIDPGVNLSEAQKANLTAELGADYSEEIYANGYYIQIDDATANIRQQRVSPPCNLVYTYGGSIHKLTLPAIAVV